MESKLIKIEAKDYGLKETKAKEISNMFKPMLDKMEELESEFNHVMALKITPETCKEARKLRLQYRDVRTGTKAIHKDLKSFYLNGGRFVDGWKNAQLMASEGIEEKLLTLERHFEILREKELAELEKQRLEELNPYLSDIQKEYPPAGLGQMTQDVWDNYLVGAKANHEAREAAIKKAEEERIAEENRLKEEKIEKERIENIGRQREIEIIDLRKHLPNSYIGMVELGEMPDDDYDKMLSIAKVEKEKSDKELEELKKENQRKEEEAAKKEEERQKEVNIAKEKQDKIDAENQRLKEEIEAKNKADQERIEKEEKEAQSKLNASDKVKVDQLKTDLRVIKDRFTFKSKKNNLMFQGVVTLIEKIIKYIDNGEN